MEKFYTEIKRLTFILLFITLLIYGVIQARMLLYPLTVAVLLAYLLYPICAWLEKKGMHRILTNFLVIVLSAVVIGGVVYVIYTQMRSLADDLPQLKEQAVSNTKGMSSWLSSKIGVTNSALNQWIQEQVRGSFEAGGQYLSTVFSATASTVASIAIMPVYIFLFLYYRDKLKDFVFMMWPPEKHPQGPEAIEKISLVTKHYMGGVFTVVVILCFVNSAGLYLIGLRYALLLGILSAICNFIPYFGTLIGAVFPLLMAFLTTDSPAYMAQVIIMFIIVQFTENNVLTPNITGGAVQINPFVTIVGIVTGGLVWGIPGMFVVVPFLGMLKILLESNTETKALAFLIGTKGTEQHALTLNRVKKLFRKKS